MSQPLKRLAVELPESLEAQIASLAEKTGRSRAVIVNNAINTYVSNQLRWVTDMDAAILDAKEGQFYDGGEVIEWLESWGDNVEKDRPMPSKR